MLEWAHTPLSFSARPREQLIAEMVLKLRIFGYRELQFGKQDVKNVEDAKALWRERSGASGKGGAAKKKGAKGGEEQLE